MNDISNKEKSARFEAYLDRYEGKYVPPMIANLRVSFESFLKDGKCSLSNEYFIQVLSAVGLLPDDKNMYKRFANFTEANYDTNCNILIIGEGKYPNIGDILINSEENKRGIITECDSNIIKVAHERLRYLDARFTDETDLSSYDLILARKPCPSTELIMRVSNLQVKPFCVEACSRCYISQFGSMSAAENYFYKIAKENLPPGFYINIEYLGKGYEMDYPFIYTKRK